MSDRMSSPEVGSAAESAGTAEAVPIHAVFEGGGAKGIAYAGALKALEERPNTFIASAAGASAGAITAALVACGYGADEIREELPTALGHLGGQIPSDVSGLWSIVKEGRAIRALARRLSGTGGALDRGGLRDWLADRIGSKAGVEDGAAVTFQQLFDKTRIPLFVVAADVSAGKLVVFHHRITPSCQVVDAVLASSAIPGALPSGRLVVHERGRRTEPYRRHTLVDGGVWANFPDFVFKDASFRSYWNLGPVEGEVVGFLLHETDISIESLCSDDYPRRARPGEKEKEEKESPPASDFRFEDEDGPRHRTEARLRPEQSPPPDGWSRYVVFMIGFTLLLVSVAGPAFWPRLLDLRVLAPLEILAVLLTLSGLLIAPQSSASIATDDHGWPRNRATLLLDTTLGVLSSWPLMLVVWAILLVCVGFTTSVYYQLNYSLAFLSLFVAFGLVSLLLANWLALGGLAVLAEAMRDWGWGVARTFLASSGAPEWRGTAPGDWVVHLPIPKEVTTLSFLVHERKVPKSDIPVLGRVFDVARESTEKQLDELFPNAARQPSAPALGRDGGTP